MEVAIPFIRNHLREAVESPTRLHIDQTQASIMKLREALDYITYHLALAKTI